MFRYSIIVSLLVVAILSVAPVRANTDGMFAKSYALVVGINEYPSASGMSQLQFPTKDADGMAKFLRGQGFEVHVLLNEQATKANIVSYLQDTLAPKLRNDDRVLFFFSGHGHTITLGGKDRGYILPYDAQQGLSSTWIDMAKVRDLAALMGNARHQYFIMDACYGGQIGMKSGRGGIADTHPNYIREVVSRTARQFLTAGGKDQQVQDGGPHGYSYFTGYLLQALEHGEGDLNGDGFITAGELENYILPVASDRNQTPGRGYMAGHALGEFVFTTAAASRPVMPVDTPETGYVPSFKGGAQYPWDRTVQVAVKPSFNCARATQYVEHLICETPALTVVDRDLGDAYKNLRASLLESDKLALREEQREWIQFRDSTCEEQTRSFSFAEKKSNMIECLGNETWLRTEYLKDQRR